MTDLTPKQQAYQAIWALRKIGLMIGMFPSHKRFEPSLEELQRRQKLVGHQYLAFCFLLVVSENCPPIARAAFCAILDYAMYGWQKDLPPSMLGYVIDRDSPQVRQWRQEVFERDGYQCTKCGAGDRLHAHHIARWADHPGLRIEIDNGMTLCKPCHEAEHRKPYC